MAREPNITQEQVSKTAEQIRDAGGRPTARAVRERLGTGSMATVLKFFQAWQDAQAEVRYVDVNVRCCQEKLSSAVSGGLSG
ncbi:TPA: DNA-binding protein [Burkholderia contaminans]|nr:DNA-binding protein [Burkholderia contaminans]